MTAVFRTFSFVIVVLATIGTAVAEVDHERTDFYRLEDNFVTFASIEGQGATCAVRLSNGTGAGAITFITVWPEVLPFTLHSISGHELGTGTTHGARRGDPFEVRVDNELLATGTLEAGVAPYGSETVEWHGSLLDALAYGTVVTWGFPEKEPIVTVAIPDNEAMTRALVLCNQHRQPEQ